MLRVVASKSSLSLARRYAGVVAQNKKWTVTASKTNVRALSSLASSSSQRKDANDDTSSMLMARRLGGVFLAAAAGMTWAQQQQHDYESSMITSSTITTDCSGIMGVVGNQGGSSSRDYFQHGLTIFKNQGFDGVGMASVDQNKMVVTKCVILDDHQHHQHTNNNIKRRTTTTHMDGMMDMVQRHYESLHSTTSPTGLAHTRWATAGAKSDPANVHPHLDSSGKIALVHNGTLTNGRELKRELEQMGYQLKSQTDSEVIVQLIGHYYYNNKKDGDADAGSKISLKEATRQALQRCDGTWGLCLLCADNPNELIVACNGSSLYLGIGDDRIYVASESQVFQKYTKNFILLKDGEIGVLHADGHALDLTRQESYAAGVHVSDPVPDPYQHWTLKEIMEQPEAIGRALCFGGRLSWETVFLGGPDSQKDRLSRIQHMIIGGCGSSLNAAKYGELLFKHLQSVPGRIACLNSVEAHQDDYPIENAGLIAVSQSGETKDTNRVAEEAMEQGVTALSVVNTVGSRLARATKLGVYCHAGTENGVASTKTFTAQVTILALLALWFRQLRDKVDGPSKSVETERLKEAMLRLPISLGMALKSREKCQQAAKRLQHKEHCFVLGKGFAEPIACEGAQKIKEMSNLHAEGFSGGALKHGPFALIEDDQTGTFGATPIILLILDDEHAHHMRICAEEVLARGADLIIITDKPELAKDLDDNPIVIPSNGPMTALGAMIPLQLIAYELALLRDVNPDTPRNLAKYHR
jgi:glucosamine--fructose-6-phosphate aminotransferase (isomerizing)